MRSVRDRKESPDTREQNACDKQGAVMQRKVPQKIYRRFSGKGEKAW